MSRRVRASLLEDEVAGLELENLQLRRHLSGLEAKIKRCSIAPQNETPETVEVKKQLVALEAQQESESGEEDLKSDKILRGMIASRNWRRFAQTLRHLDRENEMDEIEVENAELKEKMRHMEESIKQVKADNKKLQHQMQEDIRIQNRYKDAQKQLENAQMETDLQRSRVADMKEMLEHMELEMSFAKLDVRPKDQDLKANRPEFDAPRVGRVSVEEEADHIFKQLQQQGPFGHGSNQLVSPEFISRSVRLIKKNLLLQRKMSGLLEWRSEATVNKLQLDLSGKVQVAEAAPSQPAQTGGKESELRNLVQDLQETLASEHLKFSELQRQHLGYAELKLTHGKMKDEMVSQEQQNRKHAKLEMEAKVEADMVRRELQMKSSELVSASRALQEMKRRHVGVQDQANLLEQSYVQLRSEHQSSESMLAALQEEHQVQQRKLQKLAATTSTSSSDRAEVVAIGQRYAELQSTHQKMKDEMMSQEHQNREYARVESEAKAQEDSVRKELQMKTSEVASANRALQEAKQQLVGTQDRADLLEQSYVQLRSEHQSSESMLAALQEEHQVQQRQLQKLAATTSTSSSDRAEVVAIGQRYAELQLAHQKIKDELVSQEHQNREFARLESEAKAREDTVRTELQMKTSEVASANRALQEAKQQNHSESEVSSTSPVSFKDSVFLATKGPETASQGAGMAALRRARASLASQASPKSDVLESPGAPESGLKATMAALKLRAMAKATPPASPASLASPAASTPPSAAAPQEAAAKSPAVLAAHRAKASTLLLKALKTASNEPG